DVAPAPRRAPRLAADGLHARPSYQQIQGPATSGLSDATRPPGRRSPWSGALPRATPRRSPRRSAQQVFRARDEHAGAAGLAPDALVARARLGPVVVAGEELS